MTFVVDGQRQPKPEPQQPLRLRSLLEIPQPLVRELPMSAFYEASEWIETERMDL